MADPLDNLFGEEEETGVDPLDNLFDEAPAVDPLDNLFDAPAPQPVAPAPEQDGAFMRGVKGIGSALSGAAHSMAGMQQRLLDDPDTAGIAGAVLAPLGFFLGIGDTAIAETEKENRHRAAMQGIEYTPQGPADPLLVEKIGGAIGRIGLSGGYAPLVEAAAKGIDIAQNEPEQDLASLSTAGRMGVAGLATYLPIKGGAAVEGAVARSGLGRLGGFLANAGADAALGLGAGTAMKAADQIGMGQELDLTPTTADLALALPSGVAAGISGLRGARRRIDAEQARANEPVTSPERIAEIEQNIQDEIAGLESILRDRKIDRHNRLLDELDAEYEADVARAIDEAAPNIANRRNVGLNDRVTGEPLALPPPDNMTAGENPGVAVGLSPLRNRLRRGGDAGELRQREVEGQTPGGTQRLNRSVDLTETPQSAGEAVINSRGEPVELPGRPVSPDAFNPELGEYKTSKFTPETEAAVNRASYENTDALQEARRGTRTIDETRAAATKIAEQRGASIVNSWKPGESMNAEKTMAIDAYMQGVQKRIGELERADVPDTPELLRLNEEMFKAVRVAAGVKTEAGRALNALRYSIDPVGYDGRGGSTITPTDKVKAAEALTKVYGDKPVPQSVIDEIGALKPDDVQGMANILERQYKVNNKTSLTDAAMNTYKAGMLTSLRTHIRNIGGLTANTLMRDADTRLASVMDWAMSKKSGQRSVSAPGLGMSILNAKSAVKEGAKEGLSLLRGDRTDDAARMALERFEFNRDQYTGDSWFNKAWDGYVNTVFRSTAAMDMPARKFAYKQSMVEQAQVIALNEVKAGAIPKSGVKGRVAELLENPSDTMKLEAGLQSEMAAFADKNRLAELIQSGERTLTKALESRGNAGKLGSLGIKAARSTNMPFLKTPLNISYDIISRAVAPLKVVVDGVPIAFRKAPITQAEQKAITMAAARGGIGYAVGLLGYYLGAKGYDVLTGTSEQETTGMRETNTVAGKQPGSITIGGKNYRVQDVFSPVSNIAILGNSIAREASKPLKNEDRRAANVAGAAARAFIENPFFQGIERASNISDPGGIERYVQDSIAAAVPNVVSDIASLTDDLQREGRKQEGDTFGDVLTKSVQKKIPGLRRLLPARVNALGETQPEDKMNVVDATFSRDARWKNDKAIGELVRLDIGLTKPEKKKDESQEQYLARVKRNGDNLKAALDRFVSRPDYDSIPDDAKRKVIDKIKQAYKINR